MVILHKDPDPNPFIPTEAQAKQMRELKDRQNIERNRLIEIIKREIRVIRDSWHVEMTYDQFMEFHAEKFKPDLYPLPIQKIFYNSVYYETLTKDYYYWFKRAKFDRYRDYPLIEAFNDNAHEERVDLDISWGF